MFETLPIESFLRGVFKFRVPDVANLLCGAFSVDPLCEEVRLYRISRMSLKSFDKERFHVLYFEMFSRSEGPSISRTCLCFRVKSLSQ